MIKFVSGTLNWKTILWGISCDMAKNYSILCVISYIVDNIDIILTAIKRDITRCSIVILSKHVWHCNVHSNHSASQRILCPLAMRIKQKPGRCEGTLAITSLHVHVSYCMCTCVYQCILCIYSKCYGHNNFKMTDLTISETYIYMWLYI